MYTLINGWTKESLIAHVKKNFKGRSVNSEGKCSYRGSKGKKCAVGMFIPDDLYTPDMEQEPLKSIMGISGLGGKMPFERKGMAMFQNAHDTLNLNTKKDGMRYLIQWIENNAQELTAAQINQWKPGWHEYITVEWENTAALILTLANIPFDAKLNCLFRNKFINGKVVDDFTAWKLSIDNVSDRVQQDKLIEFMLANKEG